MDVGRKIGTLRALPPPVRRRLPGALTSLALVSIGLRVLGFARLHRWLERRGLDRRAPGRRGEDSAVETDARAVALAARNLPLRALCLERSLTLWWLLRRRGLDAELRIGVRRTAGALEAHAWVETAGRVVNDAPDVHRHYAAFDGDVATIAAAIRQSPSSVRPG